VIGVEVKRGREGNFRQARQGQTASASVQRPSRARWTESVLPGREKPMNMGDSPSGTKVRGERLIAQPRRYLEVRWGELLGDGRRGGDRGNQHTGGKSHASEMPLTRMEVLSHVCERGSSQSRPARVLGISPGHASAGSHRQCPSRVRDGGGGAQTCGGGHDLFTQARAASSPTPCTRDHPRFGSISVGMVPILRFRLPGWVASWLRNTSQAVRRPFTGP
jgi:hypothetical protein